MVLNEINLNKFADFREQTLPVISDDSIFYLVHLVTAGSNTWLRHDGVLADTTQGLMKGIRSVSQDIKAKTAGDACLVFLGNLLAKDEDLARETEMQDIQIEIAGLRAANRGDYSVYGLVDGNKTILMSVDGADALDASMLAAKEIGQRFGMEFLPLEVSLASSAINFTEIDAQFTNLSFLLSASGNIAVH